MFVPDNNSARQASIPELEKISTAIERIPVTGLNIGALMDAHRKNMQTVRFVNQTIFESFQGYVQRQAALLNQMVAINSNFIKAIMVAPTAQEKVVKQAEASKAILNQSLLNTQQATETFAKCNYELMELVSNRMSESMEEMRDIVKPKLAPL
jgi:phasin family protein